MSDALCVGLWVAWFSWCVLTLLACIVLVVRQYRHDPARREAEWRAWFRRLWGLDR